jgi:hypothetical protein
MQKAIFFAGCGTAFQNEGPEQRGWVVYPETLPALRFVTGRGFLAVLVTPNYSEYQRLVADLQGKALTVYHWDIAKNELVDFIRHNDINLAESYFITDGQHLETMQKTGCKIILVLSGRGCDYLDNMESDTLNSLADVCRDIYAAAFSVAQKLL